MSKLSANFTTEEAACPCGCGVGASPDDYPAAQVALIQGVREIVGHPLHVNSWARCDAHNRAVCGTENSAHLRLAATDLRAVGGIARYDIISAAVLCALRAAHNLPGLDWQLAHLMLRDALRGIGVGPTFVHLDTDVVVPRPAAWGYGGS